MLDEDDAGYPVEAVPSAMLDQAIARSSNVALGPGSEASRIGFLLLRPTPALFDHTLSEPQRRWQRQLGHGCRRGGAFHRRR